ncbi:AAA family ATPase [Myxococcota bacterium]|nr:AAA family ATPase [Myxococcota bacterium]
MSPTSPSPSAPPPLAPPPLAPLPVASLRPRFDLDGLDFQTTADLPDLEDPLGQERAVEALRFALGLRHDGYNVYVMGTEGSGRRHLAMRLLRRQAAGEAVPPDVVYVMDFARPIEPRALRLPAGRGAVLRADLDRLVDELRPALAAAFDAEEHLARRRALDESFEERRSARIEELRAEAEKRGVGVLSTPTGIALVPLRDGAPIPPDDLEHLPPEEQERLQAAMDQTREQVASMLRLLPRWAREQQERVRELDRETAAAVVDHLLEEPLAHMADQPAVQEHLARLRQDVLEQHERLLARSELPAGIAGLAGEDPSEDWRRRYRANLLVDHAGREGAPVVHEDNPTLPNLVGRVEYHARLGTLVTDFSLIRPGALHRANGGYLVLEARKVLSQPASWEQLKRALRAREIRIESLAQTWALTSTTSLQPQPVPLAVKVVMVGERELYGLLSALDPEFGSWFKVPADLEEELPRGPAQVAGFCRLVASLAREEGLRPFGRAAVQALLERASRLADDQEKLATHIRDLVDLLREADHYAAAAEREVVDAADVQAAVRQDRLRRGRLRQRLLEAELRGQVLVRTEGAVVGQVNGLAVARVGRAPFGRPSRITARVQPGSKGVIDIEREVELSGPIHAKGVMILGGYIGARYARQVPLAFTATVVFEQSYGGVEGDSASLAETLALLSALGELPLRQDVAVTGAVDQHGNVEAVGGVNEKIEGFFELCAARGLHGQQGVVIPQANVSQLVLDEEVVAAATEGRFHVWAVQTVDEALALVSGMPAGERDAGGDWPEGSANARIEARLVDLAELARAWAARKG